MGEKVLLLVEIRTKAGQECRSRLPAIWLSPGYEKRRHLPVYSPRDNYLLPDHSEASLHVFPKTSFTSFRYELQIILK